VTHSCDCGGSPKELWSATRIEHLTGDDGEEEGKALGSNWCSECGAEFCAAILAGETKRSSVVKIRNLAVLGSAVRSKATDLRFLNQLERGAQ
jgi:hypothetical protein